MRAMQWTTLPAVAAAAVPAARGATRSSIIQGLRRRHHWPPKGARTRAEASRRTFTSSAVRALKTRGIVYEKNGDPRQLVRGHSWDLPRPADGQVVIRVGLASINPADINVVQGVYPAKPSKRQLPGLDAPVFVGGNEGFGIVEEVVGDGSGLRQGDWVVFGQPQMGTWTSHMVCAAEDVVKIDRDEHADVALSGVMASTLQVNPATALRMLHDFVQLDGTRDVLVQNAANSAVGQAVAQLAARTLGVESINLVRGSSSSGSSNGDAPQPRPDMGALEAAFARMGDRGTRARAHLFTYEALTDRGSGAKEHIREILGSGGGGGGGNKVPRTIRLGLNALCGPDNLNMAKLMGPDATLVTYGAMSRQPLALPAGLVIFNNMSVKGFMMNRWYAQHGRAARQHLMRTLVARYQDGTLEPPPATIVDVSQATDADDMAAKARDAIAKSMGGYGGRKFFFKFS